MIVYCVFKDNSDFEKSEVLRGVYSTRELAMAECELLDKNSSWRKHSDFIPACLEPIEVDKEYE